MKDKQNRKQDNYDYSFLEIYDSEGIIFEDSIDTLLDVHFSIEDKSTEDNIHFLNKLIKDIEHYRDSLVN